MSKTVTRSTSLYERYAPELRSMPLISFLVVFVVLPITYSWGGFAFMLGTILFTVGAQPHIAKLSDPSNRIDFAFQVKGKRQEWSIPFHLGSRKWVNRIVGTTLLLLIFLLVPVIGLVLKSQGVTFAERIEEQREAIQTGLSGLLGWLRSTTLGEHIPQGDVAGVLGGIFNQIFGDLKHLMLTISGSLFKLTGVLIKDWLEIFIAGILLGVLIQEWQKEAKNLSGKIKRGITNDTLRVRTLRYLQLYQDGLSILMIGYLEVGATLSVYYFLAMVVLPFNLSLGALILFSLIFGFITAVWKVGGIATKIIGPIFMVLNFQPGLGWFGYEVGSFGLFPDIAIKAAMMFVVAFIGGALEAYNYTPEKVGKKLGLTKMEMVTTILIWAIGTGFFGMIWGVLAMLTYQAWCSLDREVQQYRDEAGEDGEPDYWVAVSGHEVNKFGAEEAIRRGRLRGGFESHLDQPELDLGETKGLLVEP